MADVVTVKEKRRPSLQCRMFGHSWFDYATGEGWGTKCRKCHLHYGDVWVLVPERFVLRKGQHK